MLRYVTRRAAGWFLVIAMATNATYFLASWFLDPRSNFKELRPVRTEEQISRALAPTTSTRTSRCSTAGGTG